MYYCGLHVGIRQVGDTGQHRWLVPQLTDFLIHKLRNLLGFRRIEHGRLRGFRHQRAWGRLLDFEQPLHHCVLFRAGLAGIHLDNLVFIVPFEKCVGLNQVLQLFRVCDVTGDDEDEWFYDHVAAFAGVGFQLDLHLLALEIGNSRELRLDHFQRSGDVRILLEWDNLRDTVENLQGPALRQAEAQSTGDGV